MAKLVYISYHCLLDEGYILYHSPSRQWYILYPFFLLYSIKCLLIIIAAYHRWTVYISKRNVCQWQTNLKSVPKHKYLCIEIKMTTPGVVWKCWGSWRCWYKEIERTVNMIQLRNTGYICNILKEKYSRNKNGTYVSKSKPTILLNRRSVTSRVQARSR